MRNRDRKTTTSLRIAPSNPSDATSVGSWMRVVAGGVGATVATGGVGAVVGEERVGGGAEVAVDDGCVALDGDKVGATELQPVTTRQSAAKVRVRCKGPSRFWQTAVD